MQGRPQESPLHFYGILRVGKTLAVLIPFIGSAVGVYTIVLQIFMTMAVHRMRSGRATLAVLLLPIIGIVLGIIGGIVLVAVLVAAFQHVR